MDPDPRIRPKFEKIPTFFTLFFIKKYISSSVLFFMGYGHKFNIFEKMYDIPMILVDPEDRNETNRNGIRIRIRNTGYYACYNQIETVFRIEKLP